MRRIHYYLSLIFISLVFSSCSSSSSHIVESTESENQEMPVFINKKESRLADVFEHPKLFLGSTITVSGQVQSSEVRKLTKHLSLLTFKLSDGPGNVKINTRFHFLEKLREAEDLISSSRYKNVRLSAASEKKLYETACDLKIAASRIEALSHYFNGIVNKDVANAMSTLSSGYSDLGESFLAFQKAASASSPAVESNQKNDDQEEISKFEESVLRAGGLMLVFAHELEKSKDMISSGYYSFDAKTNLNLNRSYEILTYGSLLKAEAWKQQKSGNEEYFNVSSLLSKAVVSFGEGNKKINAGLSNLSETLNKTAIRQPSEMSGTLKCAYYGFNRSHLARCLNSVNKLDKNVRIKVSGQLRKSNLREEVDVLWLHAQQIEIDGVKMSLNYGDSGGTVRSAMDLYEWAESVEKGK